MNIAYIEPLQRGFGRMRTLLFNPFEPRTWLVMGFAAWLARLMDGQNGASNSANFDGSDRHDGGGGFGNLDFIEALSIGIIGFVILAFVVTIVVLLLWLSSRGKFVFLDNVVRGEAAIKEPWKKYASRGDSLFRWRLAFTAIVIAAISLVAVPFVLLTGLTAASGWEELSIVSIVLAAITVGIMAIPAAYIDLFLDSFIAPIMYKFDVSASEAWRRFMPMLRTHLAEFAIYGILTLVINVLVTAAILGIGILTCCVGLLLFAMPYVGTVLTLPVWVTLRGFSLEFLAQFGPDLQLFPTPDDGGPAPDATTA